MPKAKMLRVFGRRHRIQAELFDVVLVSAHER